MFPDHRRIEYGSDAHKHIDVISLIQSLYPSNSSNIPEELLNSDLSEPFPIGNGVKQGCVLAPTLFNIFFSMMLKQATEDLEDDDAVYIRYRRGGCLFNLRRLQAYIKTLEQLIRDPLFADDAALVAYT